MAKEEINEAFLRMISELTRGTYFRASDEVDLTRIFDEIERLEKTEIEVQKFI